MPVPDTNPATKQKADLGRRLFFDKRLSADLSVSCATCHDPAYAFSIPAPVATGIQGQKGSRRPPRLINRGYGRSFFWDGRAPTLEDQVVQPIANPIEMGFSIDAAAGRTGLPAKDLRNALATYVRTILSGDSPYDRYMAGDPAALGEDAQRGLRLFLGRAGCASCHAGPNFTDEKFHNTGVGSDRPDPDPGRFAVTARPSDQGAFKTPGLREASRTPPYMHDGSIGTLDLVLDFYDKGGRPNPRLDREIRPLHLSADEKRDLVAFLRALEGKVRDGL
jgi:cytochrome c peroxidase